MGSGRFGREIKRVPAQAYAFIAITLFLHVMIVLIALELVIAMNAGVDSFDIRHVIISGMVMRPIANVLQSVLHVTVYVYVKWSLRSRQRYVCLNVL